MSLGEHGGPGGGGNTGIFYHGGPLILGTTNVYYIWYGNWSGNSATSILQNFANNIGGSPYFNINTTYYDGSNAHVSNSVNYAGSKTDSYSRGSSIGDADVQAIVAYLRSQPAVEHATPIRNLSAIAAAFAVMNPSVISAQQAISQPVVAHQPGSAAYGEYLARAMGCGDCHGPNLAGQSGQEGLSGPNLTVIVPNWSEGDFMNVFNKGIGSSGNAISDEMPWKDYRQMFTDEQLKDLYSYLHGLAPVVSSQ